MKEGLFPYGLEVLWMNSRTDGEGGYVPYFMFLQVLIEETIDFGAVEVVRRDGEGCGDEQILVWGGSLP